MAGKLEKKESEEMFSGKRSAFLFLVVMAFRIIHCRGFGPIFSGTLLSTTLLRRKRGEGTLN